MIPCTNSLVIRFLAPAVLAWCATAAAPAAAQGPAAVTGTVTDASGRVLPGTTIEARRGLRAVAEATTGQIGRAHV